MPGVSSWGNFHWPRTWRALSWKSWGLYVLHCHTGSDLDDGIRSKAWEVAFVPSCAQSSCMYITERMRIAHLKLQFLVSLAAVSMWGCPVQRWFRMATCNARSYVRKEMACIPQMKTFVPFQLLANNCCFFRLWSQFGCISLWPMSWVSWLMRTQNVQNKLFADGKYITAWTEFCNFDWWENALHFSKKWPPWPHCHGLNSTQEDHGQGHKNTHLQCCFGHVCMCTTS